MSQLELLEIFLEEALGYQNEFNDGDADLDDRVRAAKGLEQGAALVGEDTIARAARALADHLRHGGQDDPVAANEYRKLIAERLADLATTNSGREPGPAATGTETGFSDDDLAVLQALLKDEASEILATLTDSILEAATEDGFADSQFDELMRATHGLKGTAGTVGLAELSRAAHALEEWFGAIRTGEVPWSRQLADQVVEALDAVRAYVDAVGNSEEEETLATPMLAKLGLGPNAPVNIQAPPTEQDDASQVERDAHPRELRVEGTGSHHRPTRMPSHGNAATSEGPAQVLRVDASKVDRLMDSAGELVFDRTRIERRIREVETLAKDVAGARKALHEVLDRGGLGDGAETLSALDERLAATAARLADVSATLLDDTDALRRTTSSLEHGLTEVRMQSIGGLFERLAPQVRAFARQAGKRVRLVTEGEDTEFDKAVADRIVDPVIQLIRNAVAHGIEDADARSRAGKSDEGVIKLSARQEGAQVILEVSDDGAGIQPQHLRRRFVARGAWTEERAREASDEDVLRAIFDAGMSSRSDADELAGRGVGLDAVRETLARLAGEIHVVSSPGYGTRFTIRLPLTTALNQAMLFKVGGEVFALPNAHIEATEQADVEELGGGTLTRNGEELRLIELHRLLATKRPDDLNRVPVMLMAYAGKRIFLVCDKIVGPRQIVIKSLGSLLSRLPLYGGGTISGSGKVQLILDPAALVRAAYGYSRPAEGAENGSGGRVLIVDDSPASREAASRILQRAGFEVDLAADGEAAWHLLLSKSYDAVVTDLEMPVLDGFGLIERIQRSGSMPTSKVVVVSSRTGPDERARASKLGVTALIAKPVRPDELVAEISKARNT